MLDDKRPYTFDRVVRMVLTAAVLIGLFLLIRHLSDVLIPFVAAVVLAYILNPVVVEFEKRTKRRGRAVAFTLVGLGIVALALAVLIMPLIYVQLAGFSDDMGNLRTALITAMEAPAERTPAPPPLTTAPAGRDGLSWGLNEFTTGWAGFLRDTDRPLGTRLGGLLRSVEGTLIGDAIGHAAEFVRSDQFDRLMLDTFKRLAAGGVTVINFALQFVFGLTALFIVLIYLVFLLLDYPEYVRTWREFLPPRYREGILDFLDEFDVAMRRYFRGQFVIASLTGILFAFGFWLIGLPMAIPFGLFIGVLNMVPYLQVVAIVPALLLAILRSIESGSLLGSFVWVGVVFVVVQVLQDAVLTPRIMGKATGLRPVAILLGVFIWGKLLGFLGLLLAIPFTCLGIAYYRRFVLQHSRDATSLVNKAP